MKKNVITGIGFLAAAIFVIVGSMGLLGEISVWTLLFTFILVVWLVKGLFKLQWTVILFSLAFLAILYDGQLGIENLTPWPVLGAALLGSIGFSLIFRKSYRHRDANGEFHWNYNGGEGVQMIEQIEDEHRFSSDVAFGSIVKYIKCQSLREVVVDNSFGNTTIYFDEAILDNGMAKVDVDNSFGCVKLYIPSEWKVNLRMDESFGHVKNFGSGAVSSDNVLNVFVDTSFGDVEVHYI